jgi:DNA-binding NarL/FixJ family response regulator
MENRKTRHEKRFPSLLSDAAWQRVRADFRLTRRESQILEAIARALPEVSIARDLGVALDTVRKQRRNALRKLAARNRLEAVLCLVHGYVRSPAK